MNDSANREMRWLLLLCTTVCFAFVVAEVSVLSVHWIPWAVTSSAISSVIGLWLLGAYAVATRGHTQLARRMAAGGILASLLVLSILLPFMGPVYLAATMVVVILIIPSAQRTELLTFIALAYCVAIVVVVRGFLAPLPDVGAELAVWIRYTGVLSVTLVAMLGLAENARRLGERIAALARGNRDLASMNRALTAFSHTVAHDLRNPIRTVNGFSEVLLDDCGDRLDDACVAQVHRIQRAAARMDEIVVGLLALSDVQTQGLSDVPLDLAPMATEILEDLASMDPDRVVDWRVFGPLPLLGDRPLIRILLTNLLDNAWKYTASRERAVIEVGQDVAPWDEVAFYVRDNGVGFQGADASAVFEPFHRLPSAVEVAGSGIGLATVDRIVRRYGGTVVADGGEQGGLTVWFSLASQP